MKVPSTRHGVASNPLAAAMTPMIDVVFLLLVFFLCTATFEQPEETLAASFVVKSAESGSGSTDSAPIDLEEIAIVGRSAGGQTVWTVNDGPQASDPETLRRLLRDLAAIDPSLPVTIDPEERVPMGQVILAYDAARAAGLQRVLMVASSDSLPVASSSAAEKQP